LGAPLQPQQPTTLQCPALKQAQTVLRQYQHNNLAQALGKSSAADTLSTWSTMTCLVQRSLDKAPVMYRQNDSNLKCCQSTHRVNGRRSLPKGGLAQSSRGKITPSQQILLPLYWGKGHANPVAAHSQRANLGSCDFVPFRSPVSQVRCIGERNSPTSQPSIPVAFISWVYNTQYTM
jgi:hypothetical protein